ncbi:hypothetical protein [Candidatus Mycoplasma haematohominis]|uniref:Uncharacterized protein n=1 Tax=Candidatus Mycoplasma haematohominis TaxID=1494318 RepID=A0A478FRL7_9MOLU|nr:hypothetical protein [Candidatus Mycoplasma haemohominis]GCE63069.1 hypothetical protein MHSWG343_00470 [Candidatus Mycoplasma haemohominis]
MASPAAVGGGVLGAGAIGVGSAYLAGAFGGLDPSEPTRVLLSRDSKFNEGYGTGDKIGKDYGDYLVAPIGENGTGGTKTNNRDWWEWSYKRWHADSKSKSGDLSDEFKSSNQVSKAFSDITSESDSSKALNKVCEVVYKQQKSTITSTGSSPDNPARLKRDLFKYCSVLGEVKTISEVSEETYTTASTYGNLPENTKKFIAVTGNDKFWKVRNDEFYATSDIGEKNKSKASSGSKFETEPKTNSKPSVRDICREAYKSSSSNNTNYPSDDVNKFCTL